MQFSAWVRQHRANIEFRFFFTVGVECVFDGTVDIFSTPMGLLDGFNFRRIVCFSHESSLVKEAGKCVNYR